ncbi:testis-specific gene 10 protein-like [Carassius carassius]|uniref:testis-specific gene 10 protein-like n=1 Tax=Carassius carassius TaxID=217509 RepID=UPI002868614A|nr:testis-specific gene 10 protein-like [Carassius carassius]XP_059407632.1 testis-specific gene 10 protein-like [Carassius carassius]XP_059407633.1 testis-specific gene 10 protein-like [Carassius carassius]
MLRARRSTSPIKGASTNCSPTRHAPVKGGTYDSEVMRVLRERDELQNMLEKQERHLSEIQANVKVLTAERDKTRMHYQQAQEEIAALRREVMMSKASRGPKSSVTAQSILKRVEAEREEATTDLNRMTTERDSLKERLKISQETAISERAHLEQRVEDLQVAVFTLEQERGEQKSRHAQMRETMLSLEEEVQILGRKLNTSEEELSHLRNECSSRRVANNQLEISLSENQRRLTSRIGELQNTQERNKMLDEKNDYLLWQVTAIQEEMNTLRGTVSELEQHRVSLQEQLEKKTDLLSTANDQLGEKEKTIRSLKLRTEDFETTLIALKETVAGRERELDFLRRKLSDCENEMGTLMKVKDATLHENGQLRKNLDKACLENQTLQLKLDEAIEEIEDLQEKVQVYIADISRTEDMLSAKERECRELQESQRKVSLQVESWEVQARHAETTVTELRLELHNSNLEILRLKERADSLESSLQQALSAERSCTSELSQLNRKMIHMEEDLSQAQAECTQVHTDLEKTRELCVKLETRKEAVQSELESCHSEIELLQKQLASERLCVQTLESLLVSSREKELQRQLTSQERQTEIQILKDKLSMADSKVSSQSREMAQLRTRSTQMEADLDMTKRHLSTERFERERAVQELHRQGLSAISPVLSSTMRSLSTSHHRSLSPHRSWSPERSHQSPPDPLLVPHYPGRSLTFRDFYD